MPEVLIYILIGLGALLLIAGLILFLFFRSRYKNKKRIISLEREINYLESLLSGKIANTISRIELISRSNLLYLDVLVRLRERFTPILEMINDAAKIRVQELKTSIQDKEYQGLKKKIMECEDVVTRIKQDLLALEMDVDEIVRPEEEARSYALEIKEKARATKKVFITNQNDLLLVANRLENLFEKVNNDFTNVDQLIESAEYNEATKILNMLERLFKEFDEALVDLPQICILLTDIIPNKMVEVDRIYEEMENEGYPLRHLRVKGGLSEMEEHLKHIREAVMTLQINGVLTRLNEYNAQLEVYQSEFEKEKLAKVDFDAIYANIAEVVEALHRQFIKLSNNLHEVRRYYLIDEIHETRLEELKEQVDDITTIKRNLDTYVYSTSGQHYSLLLQKAKQLQEKTELMETNLSQFKEYESSLKNDADKAVELVNRIFFKMFEIKRKCADIVADSLKNQYQIQLQRVYKSLEDVALALKEAPVNMERVNQSSSYLTAAFGELSRKLEHDLRLQSICETNFIAANLYRSQFSEVNRQMIQIEKSFWDGDYEVASQDLVAILKKQGAEVVVVE